MGRRRSIALVVLAVLVVAGAAAGCRSDEAAVGSTDTLGDDAITVASFDFAESRLLAELYSQALEASGVRVVRAFDLGSRELVFPALAQGLVEVVPEYAGSALQFVSLGAETPRTGAADAHGALELVLAGSRVGALDPAPAVDANAFVVTRDTARRHGLRTLSDVERVAGELTFGGPPECGARPFCLLGLARVYGIRFGEVLTIDVGGPLTRQALRTGHIDVGLLFSTDPELDGPDLVELVDDLGLQPAENVTPLVRVEVAERWGSALTDRLDEVSHRLTTAELRALNAAVAGGDDVAATASTWLRTEGLR